MRVKLIIGIASLIFVVAGTVSLIAITRTSGIEKVCWSAQSVLCMVALSIVASLISSKPSEGE